MPQNGRTPAALCFDVEDLISLESDDAALWLSEILHEHQLTGSFMLVGEKARLWEQRGRRDLLESFKKHHVSFHSTWHSVHPTTTEICLERNFADGMEALWEWDKQGWEDTERILGRPLLAWARTGSSWSPSIMGLMGQKGRAYAYSLVRLPHHNVCWYANCLGFYGEGVGNFDTDYLDDTLFAQSLEQFDRDIEAHRNSEPQGADWLCVFMCHPTRVISTAFWDSVNLAKGANPPRSEWKPAPQHDVSLIPTMKANYRRLCQRLQADDRLEIVGLGELIQRYDAQRPSATHAELLTIAQQIADQREVLFTDYFTAGEILLMLCQAAQSPQAQYVRPTVYGPLTMPPISPSGEWDAEEIKAASRTVTTIAKTGYLPATLVVGKQTLGLGTYFVALAEALLGRAKVSGPTDAPYPSIAESIAEEVGNSVPSWSIHPNNMDLTNLLEQTRLQCWALKPAWPRK